MARCRFVGSDMGWDITVHPVSERELQRFLFDVLDKPALLDARLAELCPDANTRQAMRALFEKTFQVVEEERRGGVPVEDDGEDEDEDEDRPSSAADGTRWLAAAIAGCRHPYWYSRGQGLLFVEDSTIHAMVRPLAEIGTGRIREIVEHFGPHITGNFEASGFIRPADVRVLAARMREKDPILLKAFGDETSRGWESLHQAVTYATKHNLGLIEADSLMVGGIVLASEPGNLRAHYLKNVDNAGAQRRCDACGRLHGPDRSMCDCGRNLALAEQAPEKKRWGLALIVFGPLLYVALRVAQPLMVDAAVDSQLGVGVFLLGLFAFIIIVSIVAREIASRTE
jgi:hypothetical protein